eukprot:scaffold79385_cov27-Tisochrysis_lutea.AAC.4
MGGGERKHSGESACDDVVPGGRADDEGRQRGAQQLRREREEIERRAERREVAQPLLDSEWCCVVELCGCHEPQVEVICLYERSYELRADE